ncbi:hypothetical protein BGW39_007665 [Mortierella sp. 14UC]|nr:hypothetical protein BGW39_007665 [Mortierella sp. 14UC]
MSREQQKAILREEHLAIEEFRELRPIAVVVADGKGGGSRWSMGLGRLSGLHHRIKGFLTDPWIVKVIATAPAPAPIAPSSSAAPPSTPPSKRQTPSYKRTIFPRTHSGIKIPDFLVQELEAFEDAAMESLELQQERIQLQKKAREQDGQKETVMEEEEEAVVIYPMSEWDPEIARLQMLMSVWNGGTVLRKRAFGGSASGGGGVYMQDEEEVE